MPPEGYLSKVRELCTKHNVLFICDEIQTVNKHYIFFAFSHRTSFNARLCLLGAVSYRKVALL